MFFKLSKDLSFFESMLHIVDIEDITRWQEDMNFMFEWQEQFERVRYCSCHDNIKFISIRVMFVLLYKHTDNGVFDDFPKISENFPKLARRPDERSRTFSENFRRLSRKARRCFDDTPTKLSAI